MATLDIECQDWDHFACGALRRDSGTLIVTWDEDRLFDAICDTDGPIDCWGDYDLTWVAGMAARRGMRARSPSISGGMISLTVGGATLRNQMKRWPVSLADAARIAGLEKSHTGLPCKCGEDCGGYCSIRRRGMTTTEQELLEDYMIQDLDCAEAVRIELDEMDRDLGLESRGTIGATAWATFRAMGGPAAEWRHPTDFKAARRGYHGGAGIVFRRWANVIFNYDIRGAYASALERVALPVGAYRRDTDKAAWRAWMRGRPGIYDACVRVRDCHAPPLPVRGADRTLYPTGEFCGTWPRNELEAALDSGDVELLGVEHAITWASAERIAAPFARHLTWARELSGPETPRGQRIKAIQNAFTGKVGQGPEAERLEINPADPKCCPADWDCEDGAMHDHQRWCCVHICTGACNAWEPLDSAGLVWSAPSWYIADCAHAHWAAYITGHIRSEAMRQARDLGDNAVYLATDGIKSTRELTRNVGTEAGQWRPLGAALDSYVFGAGAYREADAVTGQYVTACKGAPKMDVFTFDQFTSGTKVRFPGGIFGVKGGAIRGKLFLKRELARRGTPAAGEGGYVTGRAILPRGRTRPLAWSEYLELRSRGVPV